MERWKINLYTVWFSQIISLMSFGFGMPFLSFYMQELGVVDPDKIKIYTGILSAAPSITMGIMAPIWGILADKYGKKLMLLRSMFFASFVLAGMGLATRAEHLIALRLAQGLFTGTITASSALVASNTPNERLSYALGFLSSSTFIGFSLGPVIGGFIAEYVGYRISFFIGAALMFLDFILVLSFVKAEKEDMPLTSSPESKKIETGSKMIFTSVIAAMLFILFFMRISRTAFNPYLPLYIQELNQKIEGASRITGIVSGITGFMTAASGLTLSRLGDRYDKKNLLAALLSASILLSIPLVLINNLWLFTAVYAMFFYAVGGVEPLIASITCENTPPEKRGRLFGIQATVGSLGWAVSPLIGSVISIRFSIKAILFLTPIFILLALGIICMVNNIKSNDKRVIKEFNEDIRTSYSKSLISLSVRQSGLLIPLAFGESNTKSRIKNILSYKKPAFWVIIAAIALVTAAVAGLTTDPIEISEPSDAKRFLEYKTKYVGNAPKVGNIILLLDYPENVSYDYFELYTDNTPYEVTVNLKTDAKTLNFYKETYHEAPFMKNAIIMFSLIDNVDCINYNLNDGKNTHAMKFKRDWANDSMGRDVREFSKGEQEFTQLLRLLDVFSAGKSS